MSVFFENKYFNVKNRFELNRMAFGIEILRGESFFLCISALGLLIFCFSKVKLTFEKLFRAKNPFTCLGFC